MTGYARLKVCAESYAMPVGHVLEVAELGQVRPVPGARAGLLGVWNRRGELLPVADLARLLGVQRAAPPRCLLVAEARGFRAGLAIDEVSGICELGEPGELAEPGQDADPSLLAGAVLADGELVGVLDVPRVFDALGRTGARDG